MAKIALISDLHLEERKDPSPLGIPSGMFQVYGSFSLPREIDADVMVIAGDTHPDPEIRRQVLTKIEDELGLPVIHVNGNHDYYGASFPNDRGELITMGGIRFAVATLWTYLDDIGRHEAARFPDFVKIQDATVDKWNNLHFAQVAFLEQAVADVIVTHHTPFSGSVHEDFHGDALNAFFVNNLDPQRFPKTRLWLHGHVHTQFDYLVSAGNHPIRVVCNPLGYPMARVRRRVGIKIVEIDV
ncbi:metallophosphoesterase [Microvirga sp. HBU67558]|uniref:metallophosphoesterase n=1 Tax=Microvirga TaxID=186650 RepID=UPI001B3770A9|nr:MULTISPECIES: metallophosphoesterase [unclassified Microvirga]MBQ0819304.1 metallophosphoesterase [Microvirga sp. HBU67558]